MNVDEFSHYEEGIGFVGMSLIQCFYVEEMRNIQVKIFRQLSLVLVCV